MSEAVKDADCDEVTNTNNEELFGTSCHKCGELVTYADDSTYHIANKTRAENQTKIEEVYLKLKDYMTNNELSINIGKTKILELMIKQKHGRTPGPPPALLVEIGNGQNKMIRDTGECKILGATLQSNITWSIHLDRGKMHCSPA